MDRKTAIPTASIVVGVVIMLITGQFPDPFARIQVDVVEYGAPLAYVSRVIPTQITSISYANALIDAAFWSIIIFLILWVAERGFSPRTAPG